MAQPKLVIRNVNEVYVTIDCDQGISYELRDYFTFEVPGARFSPKVRAGIWDGKIRLWNTQNRLIYRGLVKRVAEFCEERNYDWEYENDEWDFITEEEALAFIKTLNLPPHVEVRDYQLDAFITGVNLRRSLILSPTGSGKSLIIYLIVRYLHAKASTKRSLVIVPTVSLVNQLASDFAEYGFDSDKRVHRVFAGQDKQTDKEITISTWQSVSKLPKEFFRPFEVIIGDEAHGFKAKELGGIMEKLVNARYRIGTTGTLDGTKTHRQVLEGHFGPVHKAVTTKELMDQNFLSELSIRCLVLKHPEDKCKEVKALAPHEDKRARYQKEMEYLITSEARNKFIRNLALGLEGNTLILFNYIEHGKLLHEMITEKIETGRKTYIVYGKTDADEREEVRKLLEQENGSIVIASSGVFSTGVNIKNLHNVVFSTPSKSRIRTLQSIGRVLRRTDKKTSATLYDIVDDMRSGRYTNYTLKQFEERLRIYTEEKFKFRLFKIDLKG